MINIVKIATPPYYIVNDLHGRFRGLMRRVNPDDIHPCFHK